MKQTWLHTLLQRVARKDESVSSLEPSERFYAIGDIHGRLDLLQQLLPQLEGSCPVVFVGDYIDRGDHSAQVLRALHDLSETSDRPVVCLLGNHEEMLLNFLDMSEISARQWLRNGGVQTLSSFGIPLQAGQEIEEVAVDLANHLHAAIGGPLLSWLRDRPLTWSSGNVTVVHAALDPMLPVDRQSRQTCLWGHGRFGRSRRKDGTWAVHGHTIIDTPRAKNGVISIDTGAFATGILTAAEIFPGGVRFLSTSPFG